MPSVRPVTNRAGETTGYRVDAKRTFGDELLRWSRTFRAKDDTPAALEAAEAEAIGAGRLAEADLNQDPPVHPADRYRRDTPEPYQPGMRVRDWFAMWHPAKRHLSPKVERSQSSLITNHILPVLGWRPLAELDRDDVQSWAWGLQDDLMPRSQRAVYKILKAAINEAILDRRCPIGASPFVHIDLERPEPTGRRALSAEQVAILARYARHTWPKDALDGYADVILGLAFTALRSEEFCRRDRHDLTLRRTVEVRGRETRSEPDGQEGTRPSARTGKRGRRRAKASKSPAGARSVQLAPSYAGRLSGYLAGHESSALWVSRTGTRLTYHTLYAIVTKACAAAVAAGEPIPPGITAHWLRKTHRTWLSEARVPRIAVDEQLGHETPGMQGTYEEPTDVMRKQIRDVLETRYLEVIQHMDAGRLRRPSAARS